MIDNKFFARRTQGIPADIRAEDSKLRQKLGVQESTVNYARRRVILLVGQVTAAIEGIDAYVLALDNGESPTRRELTMIAGNLRRAIAISTVHTLEANNGQ